MPFPATREGSIHDIQEEERMKKSFRAGSIWGLLLILIVSGVFEPPDTAAWISMAFPAYYLFASWAISFTRGRSQ